MILDKEIYVIDDFIDLEYQEDIRTILMADYQFQGKDFPWYYIQDVTAEGDVDKIENTDDSFGISLEPEDLIGGQS